ncbi:hypothetical protein QJQ45_003563 [Haematococcus lacustris]|nr:hypothetical protein QJQ45_003563 [Haematococcus lacustris]
MPPGRAEWYKCCTVAYHAACRGDNFAPMSPHIVGLRERVLQAYKARIAADNQDDDAPHKVFSKVFSDAQLRPFFEGVSEQALRHIQESMMEILFSGSVVPGGAVLRGCKKTARRTAHRVMAKKKHKKDPGKIQKASRSSQGKQRQERRDGWATSRRQVIKVPEGAVLRGCKKTRRKLREHLRLRAETHSQLRVIASLLVLRILLTCLVGYPTPGFPSAPQPPAVQPPQPPDAPPLPPLPPRAPAQPPPAQPASMEFDTDSDFESDCGSEPEPQSDSESESELEPVTQPPQRRCNARLAALAPAAPTGPPLPLDCEDPVMLRQLKDFCMFFANPTVYNQLQRRHVRHRHPMLMPAFEDPSNQALLAKLQELGNIHLAGDANTIGAHSMQLAVAMQQHYSNPGK